MTHVIGKQAEVPANFLERKGLCKCSVSLVFLDLGWVGLWFSNESKKGSEKGSQNWFSEGYL